MTKKTTTEMLDRMYKQKTIIENDILEADMKRVILKSGKIIKLSEWQEKRWLESDKLSEHLWVSEVVDRDEPDKLLISEVIIEYFEKIRKAYGRPLKINSGYRTPEHQKRLVDNPKFAAAVKSPHVRGYALDIDTTSITMTRTLVTIIKDLELEFIRIGWKAYLDLGQTFLHIDCAPFYHGVGRPQYYYQVPDAWKQSGKEW